MKKSFFGILINFMSSIPFFIYPMEMEEKGTIMVQLSLDDQIGAKRIAYKDKEYAFTSSDHKPKQRRIYCTTSITSTVEDVKDVLIQKQLLDVHTGPLYLAYQKTVSDNRYAIKFKELPQTTHIIGLLERYKNPFLTPYIMPNVVITPYCK